MTTTVSRGFALTLAVLCLASPSIAKDKKPVDPNKKICRADTADTGSIMPKRVCHTASEWAALDGAGSSGASTGDLRGHGAPRPAGF